MFPVGALAMCIIRKGYTYLQYTRKVLVSYGRRWVLLYQRNKVPGRCDVLYTMYDVIHACTGKVIH